MKILIVEDEEELLKIMKSTLQDAGFVVETASGYAEAKEKTGIYEYECIVLDLMLPDGNGLDLLKELSEEGRAEKVIITSAKGSVDDRIAGLELGADDYLPKPFHLGELTARVKSIIRRNRGTGNIITLGNLSLDTEKRTAWTEMTKLDLLNKEYRILHYFMTRPERIIDKQNIAEAVWGDNADQSDNFNFVYQQIANLKRKLKAAGSNMNIHAVYGFGYKMSSEE